MKYLNKTKTFIFFFIFCFLMNTFSQESLKSSEEDYYDFLSLTGHTDRNFLFYRTLEESTWNIKSETEDYIHVWNNNNLGHTNNFFNNDNIKYKIYAPELFTSYNKEAPFGYNDGGLWQGKGFNSAFSAGFRAEAYGFSLSVKPQLSWSQNKNFELMPAYSGISEYGYFWGGCDAPQRFGDSDFWNFDWGDTEIRYSYKSITLGFGTESIWLGPMQLYPVLHSNNAPTYPKFDIGLRRTKINIPFTNIYLGDIESRLWVGRLEESDYFDSNNDNNYNQFSGFTFAYAPSFIKGLTLAVTKVTLNKWGENFWRYALPTWATNTIVTSDGNSGEDQKAAISAEWLFPTVGLDIYGELGFDDFLSKGFKVYEYARYPFHAMTYAIGIKKSFEISKQKKLRGVLQLEWNNTEGSQDYQMWSGSGYNFGFHYQITQGYTNKGQWLGSGIGYGGNSQNISFTLYSPHGYEKIFLGRNNIDNNYVFYQSVDAGKEETQYNGARYFTAFKANLYLGIENLYYFNPDLSIKYSFVYDMVINPTYTPGYNKTQGAWRDYDYLNNFYCSLALKYQF